MALNQIIDAARRAQLQLKSDGHALEAGSVQRLIVSRASSKALNKVLHTDLARLRDLLARALDAMSRREPDGISDADWDKIIADISAELGKTHA